MTTRQGLAGIWTALITPFSSDGAIDWDAFEKLLKLQESGGVDGVVIAGTTGEGPTLTVQEKLSLIRKARSLLGDQVRVMAGTGDNNTAQSVELSRLAVDAGADALLIVTPPYNKPSPAGLQNHFSAITSVCKVPVCLYHVPGRTAQALTAEGIAALSTINGVEAVKEASGNIDLFSRARRLANDTVFLSGDDPTYLASLAVGGQGVVSVVTNLFPAAFVDLTRAFAGGDHARALAIHDALCQLMTDLFCEPNPGPLKAALAADGLCQNILRSPLAPVSAANLPKVEQTLRLTKDRLKGVMNKDVKSVN